MKRCTSVVLRGPRHGTICDKPAVLRVVARYLTSETFVCGWHKRGWLKPALRPLTKRERKAP